MSIGFRMASATGALIFCTATGFAPAFAQSANGPANQSPRAEITLAQSSRIVDPACFCWANGERFNRGETACLRTSIGRRLAQCDQVTNVMSWSFSMNDCPES